MRKSSQKIHIIAFKLFFCFFCLILLASIPTAKADTSCSQKYPNFTGQCADSSQPCASGTAEDTDASLCPTLQKCCHKVAGTSPIELQSQSDQNVELQIPIFDYAKATTLVEYIATLYKYLLIVLVPLAVIMIIVGGINWVMAAGNSGQIEQAKKRIYSAFFGLFIGLFSYILLSLVGLGSLNMPGIQVLGPDEGMILITESEGTATATQGSVNGQCFPVAKSSFEKISWNWGGPRSNGKRCHAGIDIYTKGKGEVVAIADGTVNSVGHFYSCSGGSVDRVIINHGSFTVNYGEINTGQIATGIKAGVQVKAGQFLGFATHCGMLHLELYQSNVSTNSHWYPPKGQNVGSGNYCRDHYMSTNATPVPVMDPTNTIKGLQGKMCGN